MTRPSKFAVLLFAAIAMTASTAMAQRDAGAKIRGEFGTGFHSSPSRVTGDYRGATVYAAPAPQIVQVAPMPAAPAPAPQVAQAPSTRQSFSVEPSPAPSVIARPQVRRSYSYEPMAPVYRAPAWSGGRTSRQPTYLLPKTDPRKYGG